jgi:hypothetical protein
MIGDHKRPYPTERSAAMEFDRRLLACALLTIGLVGCGSATKQQQLQSSHDALVSEAMALQRCEATNGYSSEECIAQRRVYEDHLATFKATYGR